MATRVTTDLNLGVPMIASGEHRDFTFRHEAAQTIKPGTLLAEQLVSVVAPVPTYTRAGTSDGTFVPAATPVGAKTKVGTYVLTCLAEAADGGTFSVVDPDGNRLEDAVVGVAYDNGHIAGTISDGAEDWDIGDVINVPILVGDGKLYPYSKTGVAGLSVIKGIYTGEEDLVATGAGDVAIRPLIDGGRVNENLLIIQGSAAGVGIDEAVRTQLRALNIVPIKPDEQALVAPN